MYSVGVSVGWLVSELCSMECRVEEKGRGFLCSNVLWDRVVAVPEVCHGKGEWGGGTRDY